MTIYPHHPLRPQEGTEPSVPPGTRKRINKAAKRCLRCETCNIHTDNVPAMHAHILSQRHHNTVSRLTLDDVQRVLTAYRTRNTADLQFCELCSEWLPGPNELKLHLRSRYHAVRQCALLLRGGDLLGANAGGVVVSVLPDPLPALEPGQTADYAFRISNLSGVKQSLLRVRLLQPVDGVQLSDAYGVSSGDGDGAGVGLPHGSSYEVAVRLAPRFRGVMRGVAVFEFGSGAQVRCAAGAWGRGWVLGRGAWALGRLHPATRGWMARSAACKDHAGTRSWETHVCTSRTTRTRVNSHSAPCPCMRAPVFS